MKRKGGIEVEKGMGIEVENWIEIEKGIDVDNMDEEEWMVAKEELYESKMPLLRIKGKNAKRALFPLAVKLLRSPRMRPIFPVK